MPKGLLLYVKQLLKLQIAILIGLCAFSCATIVPPTGGQKDITPPKMIRSQPKDLSTNFKGNKIILEFDEFIDLKTPEKFLIISPPLSGQPDIKVKGKDVVIKLGDSLRRNTTYNFYLGNAIVDLTESNPVTNFNFAFSTGNTIDSLSLSGNITDAFTRLPAKDALVMLYNDFADSLPMKQLPTYVSRAGENGSFSFSSLASGKYRAVALIDGNKDYMYNLPTEMIGFSSDSVQPYYSAKIKIDSTTSAHDTLNAKSKDSKIPGIVEKLSEKDKQNQVSINIFPEPDSAQHILKSSIIAKNRLMVLFRYPMRSPKFRALNIPDSLPWAVLELNRTNDTLNAWLLNKPDTLHLEVYDRGVVLDTINISTILKASIKAKNTDPPVKLKFTSSTMSGKLEYGAPLILTFSNPVEYFDFDAITLRGIIGKDTNSIIPIIKFSDSIHRHLVVSNTWNTKAIYDLYIPKNSFRGIYNDTCDSTHVTFQLRQLDEYGRFTVSVNRQNQTFPVIIQLITDKGEVVAQRILTNEKKADFGLLVPGKYGLKAIMDKNLNGRWDTGSFLKKIQPEIVLIHPKIFDVKPNWELEEEWDL